MAVNARDLQVVRESVVQYSPKARDVQVIREVLVKLNIAIRLEAFDEVDQVPRALHTYPAAMAMAIEQDTVIWPIPVKSKGYINVFVVT
jgi:hypothetical protein